MAIRSFFSLMRQSNRVYEKYTQEVIHKWNLNSTSFQVIMFFGEHPQWNTARDLCRERGLKTGIASVAIEQLVQAGLLVRRSDELDRRLTRLYLTEHALPLVEEGRAVSIHFLERLKCSMTEEEYQTHLLLSKKIRDVIDQMDQEMK